LRPGWLNVPAAPREPRFDVVPGRVQGGISPKARLSLEPALCRIDPADRAFQEHRDRPRPHCLSHGRSSRTRLVLVVVDSVRDFGTSASTAESFARSGMQGLPPASREMLDLEARADAHIELLRLRGPEPALGEVAGRCRCSGVDDGLGTRADCIDKHRVDLALSAGRHAAERAKLAGVERLVGWAPLLDNQTGRSVPSPAGFENATASTPDRVCRSFPPDLSRRDPYDVLGCPGHPEIAALVGVAIAGAQIGVPLCLPGPAGEVVSRLAVLLNHGVSAWLDPAPLCMGPIQQTPIVHRRISSR
jgi:hypothetical protein